MKISKHNIFAIIFLSLVSFPILAQGQKTEEKRIRLTESSLVNIVKKIVDAKKLSLQKDVSKKNEKYLDTNVASNKNKSDLELQMYLQQIEALENELARKSKTAESVNLGYPETINKDANNNEFENLKNELENLKYLVKQKNTSQVQPIIINPSNPINSYLNESRTTANYKEKDDNKETVDIKKQTDSLFNQLQLDDNKGQIENKSMEKEYADNLNDLKNKINNLKISLENKDSENSKKSEYERLNATFGKLQKKIFFANNSTKIQPAYFQLIDGLVSTLKNNENVDVLIKGFASKKGNPAYNEKLSMQRTEAVKKLLISKGVHPIRILTSYYGIDYSEASETEARRVEISYIFRK